MQRKREKGQALILVLVAMSLFLIGAIGLAIDGSHLYAQRQMAQTAADAAAQSAIMSIFSSTSGWGTHAAPTGGASWDCSTTDAATPCKYAAFNGFGTTAGDTVTVSFPNAPAYGVAACPKQDPVCLAKVVVTRSVKTTLMQFLGSSATTVSALAVAGIVQALSPIPIIITHPTLQDALSLNTSSITICGGPSQSVQINSSNAAAYTLGTVDLTHAGPDDPGDCSGPGGGGNFGVFGGPTSPTGNISLGTSGKYLQPHPPIQDPLASVPYPQVPGKAGSQRTITGTVKAPVEGCTSSCTEYSPGLWAGGLNVKNDTAVFKPGLYYIQGGGFSLKHSTVWMCGTDCAFDADTGYGMTIYNTGPSGSTAAGSFAIDTNVTTQRQSVASCPNPDPTNLCTLAGPTDASNHASNGPPYYGILFFNNREVDANTHSLGQGNGCWSLTGTLYITNTLQIMLNNPAHYQAVSYNGNPCSSTFNQGEIIVSTLSMVGSKDAINMKLDPGSHLQINQVALVH